MLSEKAEYNRLLLRSDLTTYCENLTTNYYKEDIGHLRVEAHSNASLTIKI